MGWSTKQFESKTVLWLHNCGFGLGVFFDARTEAKLEEGSVMSI